MADTPRIEELRRRVQSDPASIAFAALAEEYRRAGRCDEAIAACEAGLQRHPAYTSARVTLGRALLETGRFDEARTQLEHVLKVAPENLVAIRGLAEIHRRSRETAASTDGRLGDPDAEPATDPEPPTAPPPASATPPPAPLRVASMSDAPAPAALTEQPPTAAQAAAPPPGPVPHPDLAALRALEVFLDTIVRARSSVPGRRGLASEPAGAPARGW